MKIVIFKPTELLKAKYTKRTGTPGNYQYEYGEKKGRQKRAPRPKPPLPTKQHSSYKRPVSEILSGPDGKPRSKKKAKKTKDEGSIERGISQKRVEEITGRKNPSAAEIRDSFGRMSPKEQKQVIDNVEREITEIEDELVKFRRDRKTAYTSDKPVYTRKIKEWSKVLSGKKRRIESFKR